MMLITFVDGFVCRQWWSWPTGSTWNKAPKANVKQVTFDENTVAKGRQKYLSLILCFIDIAFYHPIYLLEDYETSLQSHVYNVYSFLSNQRELSDIHLHPKTPCK